MLDQLRAAMAAPPPPRSPSTGAVRHAAVALVLAPGPEGWSLLMMKRAEREGDPWSGHMSFPGGHVEAQDPDDLHASMREASEELGLALQAEQCLGELAAVQSPRVRQGPKQRLVRAFVFALPEQPELTLNAEAAAAYWFSMARLLRGDGRGQFEFEWKGNAVLLPRIDLQGQRIWGMSLGMLDELLARVRATKETP